VAEAHPLLAQLANDLDVYAALSIRRRDKVQVLDNVASPQHPDAVAMDVGGMLPICRSASGYAVFSAMSDDEAEPLLERLSSRYGHRWQALQHQLSRTKQEFSSKGFCTSIAGLSRDVAAVAVPFVPHGSDEIYVIGCGMPAVAFHRERAEREIVPQMQRVARELAHVLGH
jgi:DNA-binding IclR family transcriptional regulator